MNNDLNFEEFDEKIGFNGYCEIIRRSIFKNSSPESLDIAILDLHYRTYPRGSTFSRVRKINDIEARRFLEEDISINEFLPPTISKTQISAGRFNDQGERKFYLADHPYVALLECGIEPGNFFLYSYFTLSEDMHLIEATPESLEFCNLIKNLIRSKDPRFYSVTNHVHNEYLKQDGLQGVAYESVKIEKNHIDDFWGEISSNTNLALFEEKIPSTEMQAGWFARCNDYHQPMLLRMFTPTSQKKLSSCLFNENEQKFKSEFNRIREKIEQINIKARNTIKQEKYKPLASSTIKISLRNK